jgi:hypothetical protein
MPADDTTARGDTDLETTHLNAVLDETVLDDRRPDAAGGGAEDPGAGDPAAEAEPGEEWPPREWRETTRSAGHRQALYVALGMVAVFAVLVAVAIWASHNG